jgi:hypothetical protein
MQARYVKMEIGRRWWICALAAGLVAAAPPPPRPGRMKVALSAQPGTELDRTARQLVATELADAQRAGETPLLLVAAARLADRPAHDGPAHDRPAHDRPALFVQLQSARECGSAGCSISVHYFTNGKWRRVLDAVSGTILVDMTAHGGMRDLIANDRDRWVWNGRAYVNRHPAPEIDLKPRTARKR